MNPMKSLWGVLLACFSFGALNAQISLPYTQGFEDANSAASFTKPTYALNGLTNCQYNKTDKGRLRIRRGAAQAAEGKFYITMDRESFGAVSLNQFIMTLDLSDYVDSNVYLAYAVMGHDTRTNSANNLYVRGDSTKTWILLDNWFSRLKTAQWVVSDSLRVDSVLESNNQKIGAHVQFMFGNGARDAVYTPSVGDGVSFDNITLTTIPKADLKPIRMGGVCAGQTSLILKNTGIDPITSGSVRWWVDNVEQKKVYFKRTILRNDTIRLLLPLGAFKSNGSDFRFEVDSVNGQLDSRRTDDLQISKKEGYGGALTVGSSTADFETLQEAMDSLKNYGVCSSVTLTLEKKSYQGRVLIPHIAGLDSTKTLTIDGQDSSSTTITHDGTNGFSTLLINTNQYITFKNCRIQTTDQKAGCCVRMAGGSKNITFESCWIDMPILTSSGNVYGLKVCDIETRYFEEMGTIRNLTVHKCLYNGGSNMNTIWSDGFKWSENIVFSNNVFKGGGIDIKTARNIILKNNRVIDFRGGFSVEEFENLQIVSNKATVENSSFGITEGTGHILIENNAIANTLNNGGPLRIRECSGAIIRHNTIRGNPALYNFRSQDLDVRNNIFIGRSGFAISSNLENAFAELDHNCYYSTNSVPIIAKMGGTSYYSLKAWQSARPELNQHSIERNPPVMSNTNFILKNERFLRGEYIGVLKDIDGVERCKISPSVGAYESPFRESAPRAGFALPTTLVANGVYELKSDLSEIHSATWKVNEKVVASTERSELRLTELGKHEITLVVETCGGKDSITRLVEVIATKTKPQADFLVTPSEIWKMDTVIIENRSKNGASSYSWEILPKTVDNKPTYKYVDGTDSQSINPTLVFSRAGTYSVCLMAKNSLGDQVKCVQRAVTVNEIQLICGAETFSTASKGRLYDPGGPLSDYDQHTRYECDFAVLTCTKNLKVVFLDFDLDKGRDRLRVFDGKDNKGNRIYRYTGIYGFGLTGDMSEPKFRDTLFAPSGNLFFEFTTASSESSRGFEIEWSGTPFEPSKPVASFNLPDSICVDVPLNIENRSYGFGNTYQWTVRSSVSNDVVLTDSSVSHTFFFAGTYEIELVVKNCGGSDTLSKQIVAVEAYGKPKAAYKVNVQRPTVNQEVRFEDVSLLNNVSCHTMVQWDIGPAANVAYGLSNQRYFNVYLKDTGCYELTQIVGNAYGFDTLIDPCAIRVDPICVPTIDQTISQKYRFRDFSINDGKKRSLSYGDTKYLVFKSEAYGELELGALSTITINAFTEGEPYKVAAWIDYDQDLDFDDPDETLYASDGIQKTEHTFQFRVPRHALPGASTLRIAIMDSAMTPTSCGNVTAGQFLDFRIDVIADRTPPKITLKGARDTALSVCATWTDLGATAIDNVDRGVVAVSVSGKVEEGVLGTYNLDYTARDSSGNKTTISRTVYVIEDNLPPEITLLGPDTVLMDVYASFDDPGASAEDLCEGSVAYQVVSKVDSDMLGLYPVLYIASDSGGFSDTVIRYVEVVDREAPLIALMGNAIEYVFYGSTFNDAGYTVSDNYWDTSNIDVQVTRDPDLGEKPGVYTIEYVATDGSGNVSQTIIRVVIVEGNSVDEARFDLTVDVFPNPSSGHFNIVSNNGRFKGIEVYSLTGERIYESSYAFPVKAKTIDLTPLNKGVYVLLISSSKGILTKQLVID